MPIDTSIYQNIKPAEMPSMVDAQAKAANLSSLAIQNAHAAKQMGRDDQEQQRKDQDRQLLEVGSTYENVMKKPPEEREAAWNDSVQQLVKSGHLKPEEAIPYSEQAAAMIGHQLNNNPAYLQIKTAQAALSNSKNDPIDRDLQRQKTRAEINELNAKAHKAGTDNPGKVVRGPEAVSLGQASSAIKELEDYQKTLDSVSDIGGKNAGAVIAGIQGKFQIGEDGKRAAAVDTAAEKVTQVLGTYLQKGVLDQHTFERYKAMIPTRYDEPEVAANKIKTLKNLIAQRQNEELLALKQTGYNVDAVPPLQGPGFLTAPKKSGGIIPSANAADTNQSVTAPKPDVRMIGGSKYVKVKGGWEEVK